MDVEMDETMKDAKAGRLGVDAQALAAEVERWRLAAEGWREGVGALQAEIESLRARLSQMGEQA